MSIKVVLRKVIYIKPISSTCPTTLEKDVVFSVMPLKGDIIPLDFGATIEVQEIEIHPISEFFPEGKDVIIIETKRIKRVPKKKLKGLIEEISDTYSDWRREFSPYWSIWKANH